MAITTTMRTQVAQLYVSLFGRAPESAGLGYWVGQLDAGRTFAQVAQDMYNVDAARAYYPSFYTNQEIVGQFYKNVLGRTADDAGLAYWTAQMNTKTKGQVVADMVVAVTSYTGTDAAALASQSLFNNKVAVGQYYGENGGTDTANKILATVTATTDVAAARAAVLAVINPPAPDTTPAYSITSSAASVNEGSSVVYTVTSKNVAPGTYSYLLGGDVKAGDLAGGLTGSVTIDSSGIGYITVTAVADNTTDGDENMTITIGGKTSATVVRVLDTSKTPAPVAQTLRLTTSSETLTGGTANDTFDASLSSGNQTLSSQDQIVGGGGTDTLNAIFTGAASQSVRPTLTNITNLNFTSNQTAGQTTTVDLTNSTNYKNITNIGSTTALVVNNISDATDVLSVVANSADATFNYTDASLAGTSDTVALTLDGASGTITLTDAGGSNNIETLAITATNGNSSLTALATGTTGTGVNVGAVTVAGTANVNLGSALSTSVTNVNASAATGNVTLTMGAIVNGTVVGGAGSDSITISAITGNASVSAGAGNDTIIAATNLGATDTIDGGAGTADVLSTTMTLAAAMSASTPTTYNITNIEQLTITDAFDGNRVLTNIATGINTLNLTLTGGNLMAGADDTIQGGAGSFTVNLGGAALLNTTGLLGGAMVVRATGTGASDSLTIANAAINSTTGLNINAFNGQNVTSTGYENVTINTGAIAASATDTVGTLTITADSTASPVSLTLTGANAASVTSVSTNSTGLLTVNASGVTPLNAGSATVTISGTTSGTGGTQSITGSAGDDTITVGAFAATISGGAGNDTLIGSTGNDSLDGGAGQDAITTGGGSNTVSGGAGNDVITATTAGTESISAGDGNDTILMGSTLTSADTIDGGAGTDTLSVTAAATLTSAAFANVSNVEIVALTGTAAVSLAAPLGASLTTIDLSEATAANQLTFAAGYTGATTVLETNGTSSNAGIQDVITNTANIALTVRGNAADVTTVQVVGGTGVDTVQIIADGNTASLVNMTGIDAITMVAGTVASSAATVTNASITTGRTLTVDASAMTDAAANFTFSAGAAQAGAVNVTGATNSVNVITLTNFTGGATVTGGAGADSITSGAGNDSLSGGAGSDLYFFSTNLNASDIVVDSSGAADALNATVSGLTATTGALRISGVETLNFNTGASASTINAAAITGASRINVANTSSVTLTNLTAGTVLGLGTSATGLVGATTTYSGTLTYGLADASGASDSVTVSMTNASGANAASATLVAAAGIETVNLVGNATAANGSTLNIVGVVTPTVNVTGGAANQTMVLGTLNAASTSLNASAYSGVVSVTGSVNGTTFQANGASTTAQNSIVGGVGNDTITISSVGTNAQTVTGGAGTDTLNMTLTGISADLTSVTQVETINLTLANNVVTSIAAVTGLTDANLVTATVTGGTTLSGLTISTAIGSGAAFKSFDASAVVGVTDVVISPSAFTVGDTIRGGAGASDVLRMTSANTTLTAGTVSGFESYVITTGTGEAGTQAFTNTTGLSSVTVQGANTYAITGLASGVTVNVGAITAGGTALADGKGLNVGLASTTGTADTLTFNLNNTGGVTGTTLTADGVETITLNSSTTVASTAMGIAIADNNANSVGISLTGGIASQTLTFVSTGIPSNVNALTAASTYANSITMASGSRVGTTAMSITGGAGADSLIMRNANDTMSGGSGTDTLVITANFGLGGIGVDLSSSTDQVFSYNGSANAATQTLFENVDLSGITGNFGSDITGRATASSVMTGTANADQIAGGTAADTITGGTGIDTLNGGDGNDTFVYSGTAALVANNAVIDLVDGGAGTADAIRLDGETTIASTDLLARITNVERITASATTGAISITATNAAGTFTSTSFNTIDLSGDTNNGGTNVVSITGVTGISTITGSAGVDQITLGAGAIATTVTGGAGADTLSISNTTQTTVADSDGIAITVQGSTVSLITTTTALTATTITGGSGIDTITLAGGVANTVTIVGGAGADVITLGALHTGAVSYTILGASTATDGTDSVTNFIIANDIVRIIDTGTEIVGTASKGFATGAGTALGLGATALAAANVIVVTDTQTQTGAGIQALIATINGGAGSDIGNGVFIISAAAGDANIWYDASAAGGDSVLVATLVGVNLAALATLTTANFVVA